MRRIRHLTREKRFENGFGHAIDLLNGSHKADINAQVVRQRDGHDILEVLWGEYVDGTLATADHEIEIADR